MVSKNEYAAFATLGMLHPMKAWMLISIIFGSFPLVRTMFGAYRKNLLFIPIKSSRK